MTPLGRLLGTASTPEAFAASVWGRTGLLVPAAARGAGGGGAGGGDPGVPFSAAAADELLAHRGLRTPFVRLARDGDVLPGRSFTGSAGKGATVADQVDPARVTAELAAGTTVVLQGLHRVWAPLQVFTAELVAELGHPVQVNAYLTPPRAQGFATHYDTHDVFVVQVSGAKHWTVHEPVVRDVGEEEPWTGHRAAVAEAAEGAPWLDHVMTAGDVLYLPRGFLHSARAQDGMSLHLTIGVHPYTRADLLDGVLAELRRSMRRASSLPLGLDPDRPATFIADLTAVRALVADGLDRAADPAVAAAVLRDRLRADVPPEPVDPVATLARADAIDPADEVRLRQAVLATVEPDTGGDGQVRLSWRGGSVTLPGAAEPAAKALLAGEPVAAGALPGLDRSGSLVLVSRLLRAGLLVVVDPPGARPAR